MTPILQEKLVARHPTILADVSLDCGDGWYQLIDTLCIELQQKTDENGGPQVVAVQVKEKYGTLRFYPAFADLRHFEAIDRAEETSATVCEICGAPGKIIECGWLKTRCKAHADQ